MNEIEQLLGTRTGGPDTTVTRSEFARFELSRTIVTGNFLALVDFVDGDLGQDAWIVIHESQEPETVARTLFQYLHNYLASLYSFNEQVRTLVNDKTEGCAIRGRDISPHLGDSPSCAYVENLAFLRELRHGIQHGDFRSLDFRPIDGKRRFEFWEVLFDQREFENGAVAYPKSFVQYGDPASMAKPLQYIATFHREYFPSFTEDCFDWLDGNP